MSQSPQRTPAQIRSTERVLTVVFVALSATSILLGAHPVVPWGLLVVFILLYTAAGHQPPKGKP